eukprot:scaffold668_cov385-Prasinococcus_capsulatus_cf.AAC.20
MRQAGPENDSGPLSYCSSRQAHNVSKRGSRMRGKCPPQGARSPYRCGWSCSKRKLWAFVLAAVYLARPSKAFLSHALQRLEFQERGSSGGSATFLPSTAGHAPGPHAAGCNALAFLYSQPNYSGAYVSLDCSSLDTSRSLCFTPKSIALAHGAALVAFPQPIFGGEGVLIDKSMETIPVHLEDAVGRMQSLRVCYRAADSCKDVPSNVDAVAPTCPEESPLENQPKALVQEVVAVTQSTGDYGHRWNWLPRTDAGVAIKNYRHESGPSQTDVMQDTRELCFYKTTIRNYQRNCATDADSSFASIVTEFVPHYYGVLKASKGIAQEYMVVSNPLKDAGPYSILDISVAGSIVPSKCSRCFMSVNSARIYVGNGEYKEYKEEIMRADSQPSFHFKTDEMRLFSRLNLEAVEDFFVSTHIGDQNFEEGLLQQMLGKLSVLKNSVQTQRVADLRGSSLLLVIGKDALGAPLARVFLADFGGGLAVGSDQEAANTVNRQFLCGIEELITRLRKYMDGERNLSTPDACFASCFTECSQAAANVIVASHKRATTSDPVCMGAKKPWKVNKEPKPISTSQTRSRGRDLLQENSRRSFQGREQGLLDVRDSSFPEQDEGGAEQGLRATTPQANETMAEAETISMLDLIELSRGHHGRRLLAAKYNKLSNRCRAQSLELRNRDRGASMSPGLQKLKASLYSMYPIVRYL